MSITPRPQIEAAAERRSAGHTPGPWKVGGRRNDFAVYGADGFEVADPSQGPFLHRKHNGDKGHWATTPGAHIERSDEEQEANANLIAAAPDMLAVLKSIADDLAAHNKDKLRASHETLTIWETRAAFALAKAEGRA